MRLCFSIGNLLCVLLTLFTTAATQAQNWDWIRQSKGASTEIGRALATDSTGNIYVTGIFESIVIIEGDTLSSAGSGDIFLCKYNPQGDLIWSRRAGGTSLDRVMDIAIDPRGNILLTGGFNGKAFFGQDSIFSADRDIFISKYDSTGEVLWIRSAGGIGSDFGESLTTDMQGNVYVTGEFSSDTLHIENQYLVKTGFSDMFIAKYNQRGEFKWARQGNASTSATGRAIDTDPKGNIYVTGHFQDTLTVQNTQVIGKDGQEVFILKYNPGGTLLWANGITGPGTDLSYSLLANTKHYFYLTGTFTQDIHFGGTSLTSDGNFDIFLAKYTHKGDLVWAKRAGGSGPDNGWGLAQDSHHNILVAGGFRGMMTMGNQTLTGNGNTDIFVAKYDVSGKVLWANSAGSPGADLGYDIAYGTGGHVYTTGNFSVSAHFDTTLLTSTGREDMFLGRIADQDTTHISNIPFNTVTGQVFHDQNSDCNIDPDDRGFSRWIMTATPGDWFTSTQRDGKFHFQLDSGTYAINQVIPSDRLALVSQICPLPSAHTAMFDTLSQDTVGLNFANQLTSCAYLTVDIASGVRSTCQVNPTTLTYCNTGADTAFFASVSVTLPTWSTLVSAGLPYTVDADSNIVFEIGTVPPQECGTFLLFDSVSCASTVYPKGRQRLTARITPEFNCLPPNTNWTGASLEASSQCDGGDTVMIHIANTGNGNMSDSSEYRIFLDDTLVHRSNVFFAIGENLTIEVLAKGQMVRLEIDQEPFHPKNKWVSTVTEGCCGSGLYPISTGFANQFPDPDPLYPTTAFHSTVLTAPASGISVTQEAVPSGRSQMHFVRSETRLAYTLQFQNTSADTVTALLLMDTLSQHLDISTFRAGTGSHPYTLEVTGKGRPVVVFRLNTPTMLPGESGFISYSIAPKAGLPQGTRIESQFEAFFNFDIPLATQVVFHTIKDSIDLYPQPTRIIECIAPSMAFAGLDTRLCGLDTLALSANLPVSGKGTWQLVSGLGTIDNINNPNTTVRGLGLGDNIFEWRITQCDSTTRDRVVITRNALPPAPAISANGDLAFCEGDSVTLTGPGGYVDYQWTQTGPTTQQVTVFQSGVWQLQVIDSLGCQSGLSTPITTTVFASPATPIISQTGDSLTASGSGAFQWYDDQGAIAGATDQVFHPGKSGTYSVVVTNGNGCTAVSDEYAFLNTAIGNRINDLLEASLYPNPTTGLFTVKWETQRAGATLRLWDVSGRLIETRNVMNRSAVFDLSAYPDGMYVVELRLEDRFRRFKVLKGF